MKEIPGVRWGRIRAIEDERGIFRELWRREESDDGAIPMAPAQANLSSSRAGVLRGLHFHLLQDDHWVVLDGEIFVALVDLRTATVGRPSVLTKRMTIDDSVTIPAAVAHGFLALRHTTVLYLVSRSYDASDEYGVAWNESALAIAWPTASLVEGSPILSDRDRANGSLAHAEQLVRARFRMPKERN
jgi:dTDP-4-dehydrorhamnose 3,5-epimerase